MFKMFSNIKKTFSPKSSRRKRQSRSSSQSSSRVPSGGTTPTEHNSTVKASPFQVSKDDPQSQRTLCETLESIPYECRTDLSQNGKISKSGCDNFERNVNKSQKTLEENLKFKEHLLKEVDKETQLLGQFKDECRYSSSLDKNGALEKGGNEESALKETDVVVRRTQLPSAKNIDKRVSFTDSTDTGHPPKTVHK